MEETEGESFMQYILLSENIYYNSIYRQGYIYKYLGYRSDLVLFVKDDIKQDCQGNDSNTSN